MTGLRKKIKDNGGTESYLGDPGRWDRKGNLFEVTRQGCAASGLKLIEVFLY